MKRCFFVLVVLLSVLVSCKESCSLLQDFPDGKVRITAVPNRICTDSLGLVEGIHCNDSFLVVLDFRKSKSYSLFSLNSGKMIKRFGEIGNGRQEISLGCEGNVIRDQFVAFDEERKKITTYSLCTDSNLVKCIATQKYKVPDAQFTKIMPCSNCDFIGMGTYKDKFQYILFDSVGSVLDYNHEIYNADNSDFNSYHKFLTNQGFLAKHPKETFFVGAIRYSSNIDFFKTNGEKIVEIKSWKGEDPLFSTQQIMGVSRVIPVSETINGVLDLCATSKYVFVLYSEENIKKGARHSKTILVFDWGGNKLCKINMKKDVYYITANEKNLYVVEKNAHQSFCIKSFSFKIGD